MASILILEDDVNFRELIAETLEDEGHRVREAGSGQQAIQLAHAEAFDLVVSDVRMAGIDGIEALTAIKAYRPNIRAIVITGYADEQAPPRAIRLLVDDYVYKPFHLKQFLTLVDRVLQSASEEARHQGLLSRIRLGLQKVGQKLGIPTEESRRAALEYERDHAFQSFFVGIRSGHLKKSAALELFDQLEEVEWERYHLDGTGDDKARIEALISGFGRLRELSIMMAEAEASGMRKSRAAHQVEPQDFYRLYERVQEGSITMGQLKVAPVLRKSEPASIERDAESTSLYRLLWAA